MARRTLLLGLTALLTCVSTVGAQTWAGQAAVEVRATAKKGGVANATVRLTYRDAVVADGPPAVATDGQGRATIQGLAPGTWQIEISHPDFMTYVAVLALSPSQKPEITTSFLEVSGDSITPMKVKIQRSRGGSPSPPIEVREPPRVAQTPPPQPVAAEPPAEVAAVTVAPELAGAMAEPAEAVQEAVEATPDPSEALADSPQPIADSIEAPEPTPGPPPVRVPEPEPEPPTSRQQKAPVTPEAQMPAPAPTPPAREVEPSPPPRTVSENIPDSAPPEAGESIDAPMAEPEAPAPQPAVQSSPPAEEIMPAEVPPQDEPEVAAAPELPPRIEDSPPAAEPSTPEPAGEPSLPEPPAVREEVEELPQPPETPVPTPRPEEPAPEPEPAATEPSPAEGEPTPAEAEPIPTTPPPAPETVEPEPLLPTPAPEPVSLPAPPSFPTTRSYTDRTCIECRPGEWSATAAATVAGNTAACDETAAQRQAAERLAASQALELNGFLGSAEAAFSYLSDAEGLAALTSSAGCRLVGVVLPKSVRFVGFQYETSGGGPRESCLPGDPCPGGGQWTGAPRIIRGANATVVYSLLRATTAESHYGYLTAYFSGPSRSWRPR